MSFNLEDIKYIIIEHEADFTAIVNTIDKLKLDSTMRDRLLSKVIIWDISEEDF